MWSLKQKIAYEAPELVEVDLLDETALGASNDPGDLVPPF